MSSDPRDFKDSKGKLPSDPDGKRREALEEEIENPVEEEFEHPTFPEGADARGKDGSEPSVDEDPVYGNSASDRKR